MSEQTDGGKLVERGPSAMTPKQVELLAYLRAYYAEHECAPNYPEMMAALAVSSRNAVARLLQELQKRGRIKITKGVNRGIELVETRRRVLIKTIVKKNIGDFSTADLASELRKRGVRYIECV